MTDERKPLDPLRLDLEREDFIETFFRKGAEFTSNLLDELQALRRDSERLKRENAELRHHLASEEAIRELLQKIEKLEQEKKRLTEDVKSESEKTENYAERYTEVEKELDTMANLYVALSQLHSKFEPEEMLGVIEQLLAQFVGAGKFVIYLRSNEGDGPVLRPVHAYHYDDASEAVPWNEGPIGETAATQMHFVARPGDVKDGTPLACIPMIFGDETVGVISIEAFFEQKSSFEDIDFEFFKLLAVHSASAIVAAGLMASARSVDAGLERYGHL
jgi:hypothetical protein